MIREITFHRELTSPFGLEPCGPFRDLGPIVVLVGANGAGKSRYLRLVEDMWAAAPGAEEERAAVVTDVERLEARLGAAGGASFEPADMARLELGAKKQRLAFLSRMLESTPLLVDGPTGPRPPTRNELCIDLTIRPPPHGAHRKDPLHDAHQAAPEIVERAARALSNAENPRLAALPAVVEAARDAERLNRLLTALLAKSIEPEVDLATGMVHPRLGERRFDANELSSGERVLLTWAVFLHRQAPTLRDAVLLIDEPEVHLHPAVTRRLLSSLFGEAVLGPRGQVWMATHSPAALLAASPDRVLLVEDGALRWSEPTSALVLGGLEEAEPTPRFRRALLPLGTSDFRNIRTRGARYVDKTRFIGDVLRHSGETLLFTRPRRFGKTLNQSVLRYFLEKSDEDRTELFRGLAIEGDADARRHFQRYPVISLTFKDVKARTWEDCLKGTALQIANAFAEHRSSLESGGLSPQEADRFLAILEGRADNAALQQALRFLSELLERRHGQRVVILIDEYDTPIHSAYLNDYFPQAIELFRGLLSAGLKDNKALFKGVLTGVLRIAKESLFSGLNNVTTFSLMHAGFADHFGFTEAEVTDLLRESGDLGRQEDVREWYDGYRFGQTTIYNPWSIARYLNEEDRKPRPYWVDTSDNALIKELLLRQGLGLHGELRTLLAGGSIRKTVAEDVVLRDIEHRPDSVWGLLLSTGYLKPSSASQESDGPAVDLQIPNREVHHAFERLVQENMVERLGSEAELVELSRGLLAGDERTFEELLERFLLHCTSYHSAAGRKPEMFYEAFLLGILVHLRPSHHVTSQPNAGRGRADILIAPRKPGNPGVVLEIKTLAGGETFEQALSRALGQIEDRNYSAALQDGGATPIHEIAAVFDRQRVRVKKR